MVLPQLSEGTLRVIMKGGEVRDPIMQVLGSKKIASGSAEKERYRILLSDGKYLISFAMLSTQINDRVSSGELQNNSVIKIKRYITSVINNVGKGDKRVLIILDMELIIPGNECSKIGSPVPLPDDENSGSSASNGDVQSNRPSNTTSSTINVSRNTSMNDSNLQSLPAHPISSLSPYQNKWVIKARVTNKSPIRTWSNAKGEGKLFSMDLTDESGEIRATAFRDLVDKFYDMIEVDKVYYISKCQLKMANKQFCSMKNDYEMTFTNETIVQECHDDVDSIPQTQYNFVPINRIADLEVGSVVDVIGVCKSTSDIVTFQAKTTGRELKKREIQLVDQSNTSVDITLWGSEAENFNGSSQPIIVIKGAKVGEFGGGKNLSVMINSVLKVNPDIPESHKLRGWFDNGGMHAEATNISTKSGSGGLSTQWLSFREVQENKLGNAERGDYYQVKATILLIRSENAIYKACPTEECNKKVIDLENGMYRCEKCNREYPNFKYRLLLFLNLGDSTGNQWVNMFSNEAEKVLGMTAQEVGQAIENDSEALANITDKAHFKQFVFKCRAKMEVFNDENRLRTTAIAVNNINYKEYNAHLMSKIQQLR